MQIGQKSLLRNLGLTCICSQDSKEVQTKFGFFLHSWLMEQDKFVVEDFLPLLKADRGCMINCFKMHVLKAAGI